MKQTKNKIRKVMMLNEGTIQKIQHFIAEDRADSEVEVIRQAVSYYHDKIYPNYIFHLSPAAKLKQKTIQKVEETEEITDEEHAISLKFFPVENEAGEKLLFYRTLGHQPRLIPVEGFKEWIEENEHVIDMNFKEVTREPVKKFFTNAWGDRFREKYNIKMPVFEDEEESTSD